MNISILDRLLNQPRVKNEDPTNRIQLLSAKIHLLENDSSTALTGIAAGHSVSHPIQSLKQLISLSRARLDLAELHLTTSGIHLLLNSATSTATAENILLVVLEDCKNVSKEIFRPFSQNDINGYGSKTGIIEMEKGKETLDLDTISTLKEIHVRCFRLLERLDLDLGKEGKAKRWRDLSGNVQERYEEAMKRG